MIVRLSGHPLVQDSLTYLKPALDMKKGFEPEEDEDLSPDEEMETTKY